MKQSVAVMDFGTSKITVLIGSRGINNSINIDWIGMSDYCGFVGGEFIEPETLGSAVAQIIATAENSARIKINKLYIGVPGDFLRCEVNDVNMSLGKKRRITASDVDELHAQGNLYFTESDSTVINIQPIYYTLDDDHKLIAPVGMASTRLGGRISYILASNAFISRINAAVTGAGVAETEYVAVPLAETLYLFDDYKRDNCVFLADAGAYGTTLSLGRGDGLCRMYYFPWGGECITAALADAFDIPPEEAERLKRKVILSLDTEFVPGEDEESGLMQTAYTVEINGETHTYPVAMANETVETELARFAKYAEKTFRACDYEYPEYIPLSITGGGIIPIRGATEYISACLHRDVEQVKPTQPLLDRPRISSALGVLDMVLSCEDGYDGFAGKLKRLFTRR